MFSLFKTKKITIPLDNAQSITELESWTVNWGVLSGWSNNRNYYHKVFIKQEDMDEFVKQLKECAKFLNTTVEINTNKN